MHIIIKQTSFKSKWLFLISFEMLWSLFRSSDWTTTLGAVVFVITDTFEESFSISTFKTLSSFLFDGFLVVDLCLESAIIKNGKPKSISKLGIFCVKTRKIKVVYVKTFDRDVII